MLFVVVTFDGKLRTAQQPIAHKYVTVRWNM